MLEKIVAAIPKGIAVLRAFTFTCISPAGTAINGQRWVQRDFDGFSFDPHRDDKDYYKRDDLFG